MPRPLIGRFIAIALAVGAAVAWAPVAAGLTCAETGETPGTIESVLDQSHPRSDAWDVIAAGTITSVEPHRDDYGTWGATITMDVRYWLRGGNEPTLEFYDPPAGGSGVGFEAGSDYLVLASQNEAEDRLATGLCDLTYQLSDYERIEQLADRFDGSIPDTALAPGSQPLAVFGLVALVFTGLLLTVRRAR
jgi:hypothetical protein